MYLFSELGRKVVAVGRNYADHAKELGNAVPTTKPLLFMKVTLKAAQLSEPVFRIYIISIRIRRSVIKKWIRILYVSDLLMGT